MLQIVFLNMLLVGAVALLWLLVRAVPRVEKSAVKRGIFERWLTSQLPEKIDAVFHTAFLRTLRRVKVLTLRVDNGINQKLQRMKLESGEGIRGAGEVEKIDLKQVADEHAEEKEANGG